MAAGCRVALVSMRHISLSLALSFARDITAYGVCAPGEVYEAALSERASAWDMSDGERKLFHMFVCVTIQEVSKQLMRRLMGRLHSMASDKNVSARHACVGHTHIRDIYERHI